jgi:hypothetical protein
MLARKLSHAASDVNRECGIESAIGVGSGGRLCENADMI